MCACVTPFMSLRGAGLVCFVVVPIPEPWSERAAAGEPAVCLSSC